MSVSIRCSRIWNQLPTVASRTLSTSSWCVCTDQSRRCWAYSATWSKSYTGYSEAKPRNDLYSQHFSYTAICTVDHHKTPAAQQQSTTVTVHHCVHQHRTTAADCYPRSKHLLTPTRALLVLTRRFITVNSDLRQCMHIGASESGTQTGDGSASAILRPSTTATRMIQLQYDKTKSDITFIHFNTTLICHRQTNI